MARHAEPFRVQGHALSRFPNLAAPPPLPAPFHVQADCSDTAGAEGLVRVSLRAPRNPARQCPAVVAGSGLSGQAFRAILRR